MSKNMRKAYQLYSFIFLIALFIDQISKWYFQSVLQNGRKISLISNFLELTYVENRGAAFGLFQGGMLFFALCSIIIVGILTYVVHKFEKRKYIVILLAAVSAGAIGNMIDRLYYAYVIDFIHFSNLFGYSFPVFNIADILLTCGLPLLVIDYMINDRNITKERGV